MCNPQTRTGGPPISSERTDTICFPPQPVPDGTSLFLDLDGTLLDLIDQPAAVVADEALRDLLLRLDDRLRGRLAIISGRSLAQLDAILGPVAQHIALSGSHGSEHRWRGVSAHPIRLPALDRAADRLRPFVEVRPGMILEEKSCGVALHYRLCPEREQEVLEQARDAATEHKLHLQDGKMVVELRLPGANKGVALRRLMSRPPMLATIPYFIGDDETDEAAFEAAVELGGSGVLVGSPRESAARFRLEDPAAVLGWLGGLLS